MLNAQTPVRLEYAATRFAATAANVQDALQAANLAQLPDGVVVFGGAGRSALLEATADIVRPVRDIDIAPIGDELSDDTFSTLNAQLNPEDAAFASGTPQRYADIHALLTHNVDFTINQAALFTAQNGLRLATTTDAAKASERRLIRPTATRIQQTQQLQADHLADKADTAKRKRFLRNETSMPARAAYFAAVLQAAGFDFSIDMLDHPRPAAPNRAHTFFLGLMVRKTLAVDDAERGHDDLTATSHLFERFEQLGLTEAIRPTTIEDVADFCTVANHANPQLTFFGTRVESLVRHTDRAPQPKIA